MAPQYDMELPWDCSFSRELPLGSVQLICGRASCDSRLYPASSEEVLCPANEANGPFGREADLCNGLELLRGRAHLAVNN